MLPGLVTLDTERFCGWSTIEMRRTWSNQSVQRMRASRSGQLQFDRQRRLAPTAHARRYTTVHETTKNT
jgi:hypothetical protein